MSTPGLEQSTDGEVRARLAELTLRDEQRLRRRLDSAGKLRDPARRAAALVALESEIATAEARVAARRANVPSISYPDELPVSQRRDEIAAAIRDHQVVILA